MQIQLEVPAMPTGLTWTPALTDDQFERTASENSVFKLERTKEGGVIVHAPAGGLTGDGNSEIIFQLRGWWKTHRLGRVFDSNTGFFLPDGSMLSPDAAYATPNQLRGIKREEAAKFLRLCPAFVIELLSETDSPTKAAAKMDEWIANGAQLGWLIDPYARTVSVYRAGQSLVVDHADKVHGVDPVAGLVFDTSELWSCYEL